MSSYHPLNPSVYYAYRIENKEIFRKIVTTTFEWYKQSDRHIEYPELFDDCETCYNNLIDIIEEDEDIYLIMCYDRPNGASYYNEIGSVLEYGDNVGNDLIGQNDINFHNPNTLTHLQDFLKFLNDADLNDIKYQFTWTFLHD
jgi:hypothetical protein